MKETKREAKEDLTTYERKEMKIGPSIAYSRLDIPEEMSKEGTNNILHDPLSKYFQTKILLKIVS
jgi:hypothetical protein